MLYKYKSTRRPAVRAQVAKQIERGGDSHRRELTNERERTRTHMNARTMLPFGPFSFSFSFRALD